MVESELSKPNCLRPNGNSMVLWCDTRTARHAGDTAPHYLQITFVLSVSNFALRVQRLVKRLKEGCPYKPRTHLDQPQTFCLAYGSLLRKARAGGRDDERPSKFQSPQNP